jgi:hypothetical protein
MELFLGAAGARSALLPIAVLVGGIVAFRAAILFASAPLECVRYASPLRLSCRRRHLRDVRVDQSRGRPATVIGARDARVPAQEIASVVAERGVVDGAERVKTSFLLSRNTPDANDAPCLKPDNVIPRYVRYRTEQCERSY